MAHRPNGRAVKKHRSYTADEAARATGAAKGTVRRWLANGLPALTDRRPTLILGADLIAFLARRRTDRQRCQLCECFCFSCRRPRGPAFGEVEFMPMTSTNGMIRALCETCATVMHKRVATARLAELRALATVTIREAPGRLDKGGGSCPNDDFNAIRRTHGKTSSQE